MMVPTNESGGCSTLAGRGGGAFGTGTAATTGGRRDDEKIGRSRVFDNIASGITQSGLALGACAMAAGGCGDLTTTGAGAAGESKGADVALARPGISASRSGKSPANATVEADTPSAVTSRSVSLTVGRRIFFAHIASDFVVSAFIMSPCRCPEVDRFWHICSIFAIQAAWDPLTARGSCGSFHFGNPYVALFDPLNKGLGIEFPQAWRNLEQLHGLRFVPNVFGSDDGAIFGFDS
jgi:hypothetical protein